MAPRRTRATLAACQRPGSIRTSRFGGFGFYIRELRAMLTLGIRVRHPQASIMAYFLVN